MTAAEYPASTTLLLETLMHFENADAVYLVPSQYIAVKHEVERAIGTLLQKNDTFAIGGVIVREGVVH